MIPEPGDAGFCARLPVVRRARGYRLYDSAGRRYVDLWQLHGHAILGHRGAGASAVMKNAISKGLIMDLPSAAAGRLVRVLRELLPSHPFVRVYGSLDRCLQGLAAWCRRSVRAADVVDPATAEGDRPASADQASAPGAIVAWRPFLPSWEYADALALLPILPFATCGGPWAVCLREDPRDALPQSEPICAAVLEATVRAVAGLRRHSEGPLGPLVAPVAVGRWQIRGPYVTPRFARERYGEVFDAFLRGGVILSPRWSCPSLLPATLSDGEIAKTVGLFRAIPAQ